MSIREAAKHRSGKGQDSMIYLDNNSTTMMPISVQNDMFKWLNKGNPSSDYASACECRALMEGFKRFIARGCGLKSLAEFMIIFTSGASESNSTIIRMAVNAYRAKKYGHRPRVIISALEHKSIISCVTQLYHSGDIVMSIISPSRHGHIEPEDVKRAITISEEDVCLVVIMHANNETGTINDVAQIGQVCRKFGVPLFSDCVQTFGKMPPNLANAHIDAISMSAHKFHGPPGIGALLVRASLVKSRGYKPIICGSQNDGFRGGTENIMAIAGAYSALSLTWQDRQSKNAKMARLKRRLVTLLAQNIYTIDYEHYQSMTSSGRDGGNDPFIVVISGTGSRFLPNTILLSVVSRAKKICNSKLRRMLADYHGIIISIGSACNTDSKKASHVLSALAADDYIKRGALRISLSDYSTNNDIALFVSAFINCINKFMGR